MRLRGTKVELEEAGEDTDGMANSVSQLQQKLLALSHGKVNIMSDADTYKNSTEILRDMADAWGEMTDAERAAALELMGGKRQGNILASIIENFDIVEDVIQKSMDAEGSAIEENEKYLDSIDGKTKQFTNSLQTMWMNAIDSEVVKGFVDFGTTLIRIFDQINQNNPLGILGSLVIVGGTLYGAYKGFPKILSLVVRSIKGSVVAITANISASKALRAEQIAGIATEEAIALSKSKTAAVTGTKLVEMLAEKNATISNTALDWLAAHAEENLTRQKILAAVASGELAKADAVAMLATSGLARSVKDLWAAFLASPLAPIAAGLLAIGATLWVIDYFTVSFKEAKEQLEKTTEELETVQSEIESLNNELKTTSDRIDELNAKDKLTIVEEEELKALRAQNDELKAQIELKKQSEQILKNQQAKDALAAYERDESFKTISYIETDSTGAATGDFVELAPEVDRYLEDRRKNTEALTKANKELEKAQKDLLNTGGKDTRSGWEKFWGLKSDEQKAVDDAIANVEKYEKAVEDSEGNIVNLLKEREELYGDVGFFYGDPKDLTETQKQWNETLTQIKADAYKAYIELDNTGKAASNAFKEISSRQFFSDELENIQNQVGITGEELADMWANAVPETEDPYGLRAFIQNLIDAGIIADTSVESMQRVVDLSIAMSDSTSDAEKANKRLARSQKRLEYYKLAKELNKYKNIQGKMDDILVRDLKTKKAQLLALAAEIEAYDILGDEIDDIKQKYADLEAAKETDENRKYGDNLADAIATLIEGYQTTNLGTGAVGAARNILIPESVYEGAKTTREKLDKEYEYLTQTLGKFMSIEYGDDGVLTNVELTPSGIDTFLDMLVSKELMTKSEDGIYKFTDKASTDLGMLAKQADVTKDVLYAVFTAVDEADANRPFTGSSVFDHFIQDTETQLHNAQLKLTNSEIDLIDAQQEVFKYDKGTEEYKKAFEDQETALKNYNAALLEYSEASKLARKDAADFLKTQEKYNKKQEEINGLLDDYNKASEEDKGGIAKQIEEATKELSEYGALLEDYGVSEFTITIAMEQIDADIAAIEDKYENFADQVEFDEKSGKYQLKSGITFVEGTEDQKAMDEYIALLNEKYALNVFLGDDAIDSLSVLQDIASTLQTISDVLTGVTTKKWIISVGANIGKKVQEFWDWVTGNSGDVQVDIPATNTSSSTNNSIASGNLIHVNGSDGIKSNEHNSLVGELGREMVADPRTGTYYTVGDNGAEFVDLPKGAIVFNHKQTEALLRNGHISSRGRALVNGNAYAGEDEVLRYLTQGNPTASGALSKPLQDFGHIIEDATSSTDDAKDSFDELIDWFEILTEETDHQISVMEAQLDNAVGIDQKSSIYAGLAVLEKNKMDDYNKGIALYTKEANKFLSKIPDKYKAMAKDGSVAITEFIGEANESTVEAINNYRNYIGKVHDLQQGLIESETHISNLRVEKLQMISEEYDNQIGLLESLNNKIQSQIDLLEEQGERISANYYNAMIANTEQQIALMNSKRAAMQAEFNNAVASGDVKYASSDWYEMKNAIDAVDASILEAQTSIASFEKSIRDLHWEEFDRIIDRISSVADEAANLRDLLGEDEDMVDEMGDWTKEGIASLGLLAQEMENAEYRAKLYADEIEWLNKNWKKEGYSVDEYNEKLQELKDGQWGSIDAYENAKDAIVDLNKTRVDAVKDGLQKEIDAYEELIEKQKESLQAQKDEHDWRNTVKDHTNKISDIQRQIDALAGDTSAAANARRKQLQEELAAAEDEYNETLYDREIEMQQEALDKELEMYRENKEAEMEEWDKYLTQEEKVLQDSFTAVKANAELIHTTLLETATKYGISITSNITEPWKQGQNAIAAYSTEFDNATSSYISQLDSIRQSLINLQNQANITAGALLNTLNQSYTYSGENTTSGGNTTSRNNYFLPEYSLPTNGGNTGSANSTAGASSVSVGSKVTVDQSATNFTRDGGNGTKMQSWVPGSSFDVMQVSGNEVLIGKNGQVTGWVKKSDLVGYSSGGNSGGGSSRGGSSSGGGSSSTSKTYTGSSSSGGTYTIGSEKGKDFVSKAPAGSKLTGGDGSKWTKNSDGSTTIEKNGKKYTVPKHAKGTMGVKSDELAWIDENGLEEIVMHAQDGRLTYLTKGSAVIPNPLVDNIMEWGKIDPRTWIDKNRPNTIPANIMTQNNHIELSVAKLIHIEHADKDSIPEIQEAVKKQLDSYMKTLNAGIKKYSR